MHQSPTGSLQRFIYQEHLPVGKRAVIIGAELVSLSALMTLMGAKIDCAGMVTEEPKHQIEFPYVVMKWMLADILTRTPLMTNARVSYIFGQNRVEGIELTHKDGSKQDVECDLVVFTGNWIPEHELAQMGGVQINPVTKGPVIDKYFHSPVKWAAQSIARYIKKRVGS